MSRQQGLENALNVLLDTIKIHKQSIIHGLTKRETAYLMDAMHLGNQVLALPKDDVWQPIETAPTDRLILLGLFPHPGFIEMPRKVGGWWNDKWNIFGGSWTPTHWVELPEPLHE